MDFIEYSKNTVQDYLGTVAYVDDVIFKDKITKEIAKTINADIRINVGIIANESEEGKSENQSSILTENRNIDPVLLTNSFAEKGIHCSLLELSEDLSNKNSIKKTLRKSDIIIFDWMMHFDNGDNAIDFIKDILSQDSQNDEPALRLIVIYTDRTAYNQIINEKIKPIFEELGINKFSVNSDIILQAGYTRIIIIPKSQPNTKVVGKYSCSDLPEIVINELSNLTDGIMSLYALNSIITIRKNTHRLLSIYNKDLDPGYLSHKMLLSNTDDSKDQIYELIGSEIKSIIKSNEINDEENLVSDYLDYKFNEHLIDFELFEKDKYSEEFISTLPDKIDKSHLKIFTKAGFEKTFIKGTTSTIDRFHFEKTCHKNATKLFTGDDMLANEIDQKFSILSSLKTVYVSNEKYLQQGTIVCETKKGEENYWLCIQPKCDSVRIEKTRDFMFVRLIKSSNKFDIIIPNGEKFNVDYHLYNTTFKKFKAVKGKINAIIDETGIYFNIFNETQKLYWVGELKNDFAQLISNQFSNQISRVGIDHYEWLRRS